MCHDEADDYHTLTGQRNLAAEGASAEAVEQHETYQPKLVPESQAVRTVHQRGREASKRGQQTGAIKRLTSRSRSHDVPAKGKDHAP